MTGRIFDIQRFSIHDGPGIRTTVFFQGCPLRCRWCHNPEAMTTQPSLFFTESHCLHCQACVVVCPEGVHGVEPDSHLLDRDACLVCGKCADACPSGALEVAGREWTLDEVAELVLRDKVFYDTSGGGVTLSGGEPLLQAEFGAALLERLRAEGLHAVVDSSGQGAPEAVRLLHPLTDLWLFDLKHCDPAAHREATGLGNQRILSNLRLLDELGAKVMGRVPLIPGINDGGDNLQALAKLVRGLSCLNEVRILPYHQFQSDKYRRLGLEYPGESIPLPDEAQVAAFASRLAELTGRSVAVGG